MADALRQRLFSIAESGTLSLTIALGVKLNLFKSLAEIATKEAPATADQVAEKANLKARYVKEWLCAVACGGLIEVDESGEQFWIDEETKGVLTSQASLLSHLMLPVLGGVYKDMLKVFEKNGPLGMDYSSYGDFYDVMNLMSNSHYKQRLVPSLIPAIGMKEKLEQGIQVLDVGCGKGFQVFEIASNFSNTHITGVDISQSPIDEATRKKVEGKITNVEFVCADGKAMDQGWTNKFDLVFIFDAFHDQARPDLCLKEIYRVLKPGGLFAMVEIGASGNCYKEKGPEATIMYVWSLFHCLPVGSNAPDALCLGNMWNMDIGKKLLEETGFSEVKAEFPSYFPGNVLFTAVKP